MKMAEAFVENTGVTSKEPFSCTVVSRRIMKSALRMTGEQAADLSTELFPEMASFLWE